MKHKILLLAVILTMALHCFAQFPPQNQSTYGFTSWAINGQRVASQFAYVLDTRNGIGNGLGLFTFPRSACDNALTLQGGKTIDPFSTSAQVKIVDTTSANTETVAGVAPSFSGANCTLSLAAANTHTQGSYYLTSPTCGLKEAILDAGSNAPAIIVDQEFYALGCTSSTITSVAGGNTNIFILDVSQGLGDGTLYGWNGSAYAVIKSDGATGLTISGLNPTVGVANEAATGTTVNLLAKLTGAPSTAIKAGTGDDKNTAVIGIVTSGAGITGNAQIAAPGTLVACAYDATATTAGDFVTVSTTVAGKCHDIGATVPLDGSVVIGRVLATTAGSVNANTFTYSLMNNSLAQSKTGTGAAVLANTPTLITPVLGAATATSVTSATANPASAGVLRVAAADTLGFRNNANSADILFANTGAAAASNGNLADVIKVGTSSTGGLQSEAFVGFNSNPANTGVVRLSNTDGINWRNAANGADVSVAVNANNFLTYNGTAPTDGSYFVGPENCSMALTTGTFAANPANSGGLSAPSLVRAASGNTVLQLTTTAAANTTDVVCDFTPPTRLTSGKGVTITAIQVLYGYQTTALTSIGTLVPNKITYPASAGAAAATVAAIGGALTVTAGTSHGTPGATTTTGQCYSENISFGTPYAHITDLVRLNWQNTFVQSAASATVMQICGTIVYYSNINSL